MFRSFRVAGVSFRKGAVRDVVARGGLKQPCTLRACPANLSDKYALAVDVGGVQVGWVPKKLNRHVDPSCAYVATMHWWDEASMFCARVDAT